MILTNGRVCFQIVQYINREMGGFDFPFNSVEYFDLKFCQSIIEYFTVYRTLILFLGQVFFHEYSIPANFGLIYGVVYDSGISIMAMMIFR